MIQFVNHIIYFFEVVIRKRPEMEIFASKDVPKNNTFFLILLFLHILISDGSGDTKFLVLSKKITWNAVFCQSLNSFPFVTSSIRPKGKIWQVNEEKHVQFSSDYVIYIYENPILDTQSFTIIIIRKQHKRGSWQALEMTRISRRRFVVGIYHDIWSYNNWACQSAI